MLPAGERRGRAKALLAIGATSAVVATLAIPGAVSAKPLRAEDSGVYLVQLAGDPLATYAGGVVNIPATKPAAGQKLNTRTWNYKAYREYLQKQRADALSRAGIDQEKKITDYGVAFNGFAASLTAEEVGKLERSPGVVRVFKNQTLTVQTNNTPRFLGLSGSDGVWNRYTEGQAHAGEGQIVGVIDSGFWPESPSFAALSEPRPDADVIAAKWNGECVPGEGQQVECNNKVLGARWFDRLNRRNPNVEFTSPRDRNGHGSHTASTAAGNPADANVAGSPVGQVSGVAPAARLAVYKALWHDQATGSASGQEVDIVEAIEYAVSDGVDVINYSIGDGRDEFSAIDLAFLHAAAAGVFVAASAGNSGPAGSTADNTMPWEATVAASTHDVAYAKSAALGNGTTLEGVGVGPAVPTAPLIHASAAGVAGANADQLRQCFSNPAVLDPVKVAGKIVVCERVTDPNVTANARVDKSLAVKNAGGVGMVLINVSAASQSLNTEIHSVPTVHLPFAQADAVKAYAATANASASLTALTAKPQRAPQVIGFSSAGPSRASRGDLLKPDITAPGVDVVAAVPPIANPAGSFYDLKSGTSMSAPHIAGLAALLRAKNPTWSPNAVKSALMTTAGQTDNQGQPINRIGAAAATPFDMGSGHVRPGSSFDPGLVYDSGPLEWLQWTCGIGQNLKLGDGSSVCDALGSIDPSNLNYPSIGIGNLAGTQTVTRTVTNTTNQASVYVAKVQAPPGVTVKVTPSVLTVLPRRSATYTVEFTRTSAPLNTYAHGSITLADLRGHSVRSPFSVKPVATNAPAAVIGTGTSGSQQVKVQAGFTGAATATAFGLVAPQVGVAHIVGSDDGRFSYTNPATSPTAQGFQVTIPAGAKLARFSTYAGDYPVGTDIDLYVYQLNDAGAVVNRWASAGAGSDEAIQVGAGRYVAIVVQERLAPGVEEQDVKLYRHVVGATNAGNLTVTPSRQPVTLGREVTFTVNWSGLQAGTRYLGVIEYGDGSVAAGDPTVVSISA
jgi:subtilisin family serine protease